MSGPPFRLNLSFTSFYQKASLLLSSVLPALTIKERNIRINMLTHDEKKREAFHNDPYRHYNRSIRFIREYFKAEKAAFRAGDAIGVPIMILVGGEDEIIDVKKAKVFYDSVAQEDKTFIIYPEMYHEVLNEVARERVFSDIVHWLKKRIHVSEKVLHPEKV